MVHTTRRFPLGSAALLVAAAALLSLAACRSSDPAASPSGSFHAETTRSSIPAGPAASAGPPASGGPSGVPSVLAAPGDVTVDPLLPSALPLGPGVLNSATRGWILATYSPTYRDSTWIDDGYVSKSDVEVVYLVSPTGERYQVLELDSDTPYQLLMWNAGETTAVVRDKSNPGSPWISLDLLTGATTPFSPMVPLAVTPAGKTATGDQLWVTVYADGAFDSTVYVTDPSGALVNTVRHVRGVHLVEDHAVTVNVDVDAAGDRIAWTSGTTLTVTGLLSGVATSLPMTVPDDMECEFSGWLNGSRVVVLCMTPDPTFELSPIDREAMFYEVNVDSGVTTKKTYPSTSCWVFDGFGVGSTLVGQMQCMNPSGAPGDGSGIYTFDGTTLATIPELEPFAAHEEAYGVEEEYLSRDGVQSGVLYGRFGGLSNDGGSSMLFRWDSESRDVTVLIPAQPENPAGDRWIEEDLLSVVVGW